MKRNLFILIVAVLLLSACGASPTSVAQSNARSGATDTQKFAEAQSAPPLAPGMVPPSITTSNDGSVSTAPASQAQERIVIQNADLAIVVKDPQAKMAEIGALARRLGGFVVSSNMSQINVSGNTKVPDGSISIRVLATNLDDALTEIKTNTLDVQSENRSGEDVTDKYVDLQSQLKAKQAAADKLYEILQKADNANDTLQIFNQLTQVQTDIEVLKGQINYYDQAAKLSAISVHLIAQATVQPIMIAGWQPQGVARDAVQALVDFFQGFASFLIWLAIYIIPVAAVLILLLALLWRLLRWSWPKVFPRKATPPVAKSE
jgi:uncharacterized lipoprotein YehR (DUF1307 family)